MQLSPPHIHRRNSPDRAIHTFKNHFVDGLASVDNNFTIYMWCRKVNQAEITMNLLLTSRTNPRLSAHEQVLGTFNFNATPMAPSGKKVTAHKNQINALNGANME